jgi:hypothetical protein
VSNQVQRSIALLRIVLGIVVLLQSIPVLLPGKMARVVLASTRVARPTGTAA